MARHAVLERTACAGRSRCVSYPCGSMDGHDCQRMTMVLGNVFNTIAGKPIHKASQLSEVGAHL
jgi:hypothetical protein